MKKFLVIYHAPAEAMPQTADINPEDAQKGMEQWMAWAAKCGDGLVDMGQPLVGGQKLNPGGGSENSTREVTGYSILQADSMDGAKGLLDGHPHLHWHAGCQIEVHEMAPIPGS